jgi:hypothetical protein
VTWSAWNVSVPCPRIRGTTPLPPLWPVWYFGLLFLTVRLVAAQVTFYVPTQIADLLVTSVGLKVGLLVAVPWTCALVATLANLCAAVAGLWALQPTFWSLPW